MHKGIASIIFVILVLIALAVIGLGTLYYFKLLPPTPSGERAGGEAGGGSPSPSPSPSGDGREKQVQPSHNKSKPYFLKVKAGLPGDFTLLKFTGESNEGMVDSEFSVGDKIGIRKSAEAKDKTLYTVKIMNDKKEVVVSGDLNLKGSATDYCCIDAPGTSGNYFLQVFESDQEDGSFPLTFTAK